MSSRLLLALCLILATLSFAGAEPSADASKLVGTWQYKTDLQVATYVFRADGTFTAELKQGEEVRKFEGKWLLLEGAITYTYTSDSEKRLGEGVKERDQLDRIDESSYTIRAADDNLRTYFRIPEGTETK